MQLVNWLKKLRLNFQVLGLCFLLKDDDLLHPVMKVTLNGALVEYPASLCRFSQLIQTFEFSGQLFLSQATLLDGVIDRLALLKNLLQNFQLLNKFLR